MHWWNIPIWAIFELLSLGEFGNFISCLNLTVRRKISSSVGIKSSVDADGKMVEKLVYILKDLRNAVAHNNTVFDTRFRTGNVHSRISSYITAEANIHNINFETIADYIILISFIMKLLQCNRSDILAFIRKFEEACESFRKSIPINIYSKIIYTDTKSKLTDLKKFLWI